MELSKELNEIIEGIKRASNAGLNSTGFFTILRNNKSLTSEILTATSFLDSLNPGMGQRIYHIKESILEIPKCECGKSKTFYRLNIGYFNTCGDPACKRNAKINSFKETIKTKYNGEYFIKGSAERDKYESTMLSKYGVDHNFKDPIIRENAIKTMLEKYGVDSPLKSKEFQDKRKSTCLEKYKTLDFLNSNKSILTNLSKYGVKNPMKNSEISKKVSLSSSLTKLEILSDKLDEYGIDIIDRNQQSCLLYCKKCSTDFSFHPTTINAKLRSSVNPCPKCNPVNKSNSGLEIELSDFIRSFYSGEIVPNDRSLCKGSSRFSEVDIHIPDMNIAFEFNGLYWHSEIYKDKEYHKEKSQFILGKGVGLYHIWEDDWIHKKELVKSMIKSSFGFYETKVFARKCQIREVTQKEYKIFTTQNHLKGYCPASLIFGLYYNGELVNLMSLSKTRRLIDSNKSSFDYEIIRSCSKMNTVVIGGFSKIISHVKKNLAGTIVTYCDISFSPDPLKTSYHKSGFTYLHQTSPGYHWVIDGIRSNRLNWTKKKVVSLGCDPKETADSFMRASGYYKIWDCGNYKYSLDLSA